MEPAPQDQGPLPSKSPLIWVASAPTLPSPGPVLESRAAAHGGWHLWLAASFSLPPSRPARCPSKKLNPKEEEGRKNTQTPASSLHKHLNPGSSRACLESASRCLGACPLHLLLSPHWRCYAMGSPGLPPPPSLTCTFHSRRPPFAAGRGQGNSPQPRAPVH